MYTIDIDPDETAAEKDERLSLDTALQNIVTRANLMLSPLGSGTLTETTLFYSVTLGISLIDEIHTFITKTIPNIINNNYKGQIEGIILHSFFHEYSRLFELFRPLASTPYSNAQAQCIVGECIARGWIEGTEEESKRYFENAAAQGDRYSAWSLGQIYAQRAKFIADNHSPMNLAKRKQYEMFLVQGITYATVAKDTETATCLAERLSPGGGSPASWPGGLIDDGFDP